MKLNSVITNPFVLLFLSIYLGQKVGKLEYKNFKLGSSGGLFVGIALSYLVNSYQLKIGNSVINPMVAKQLFLLSLIGFIASVGLMASQNIKDTIKKSGVKFIILAFSITFIGALSTYLIIKLNIVESVSVIGTYVGSLTSSPGLATSLEMAKSIGTNAESLVGLGYSISYIPGVIIVILVSQYVGKKIDYSSQNANKQAVVNDNNIPFDIVAFSFVCLLGILLGKLKIYLGAFIGNFSLGSTGGVLIAALVCGQVGKIKSLNFNMNKDSLKVIRDISLNIFLVVVGLNYGYNALTLIKSSGMQLLVIGVLTGGLSIVTGLLVGKYILKLNTITLLGGICGGMTSTPGLAAAIEAAKTDDVTVGYGATYPFALFFMILFSNILFKL